MRTPTSAPASSVPLIQPASALSAPTPSGIARLRKSIDQKAREQREQSDPMSLDEFIFPSSVGSPAGLADMSLNDGSVARKTSNPSRAISTGIPIRNSSQQSEQALHLSRASAPSVPPPIISREPEFGYVQRHVRKTSIDERRVS